MADKTKDDKGSPGVSKPARHVVKLKVIAPADDAIHISGNQGGLVALRDACELALKWFEQDASSMLTTQANPKAKILPLFIVGVE